MSEPTNKEIRERHESSVEQDASLVPKGTDEWVLELLASFNYCRIDRGILLDRLEAAEQRIKEIESVSWTELRIKALEAENKALREKLLKTREANNREVRELICLRDQTQVRLEAAYEIHPLLSEMIDAELKQALENRHDRKQA